MDIDFSTVILEIINFLVLVWILQHFLYKPVLAVIAKRKQGIEQSVAEAQTLHQEAEALRDQYENRLAHWAREKKLARETLYREIEAERKRQLENLNITLAEQHKKAEVVELRRQRETAHRNEQLAIAQGARFAAKLLKQAAGPALEDKLLAMLLDNLAKLPEQTVLLLRPAAGKLVPIQIGSVYPVAEERRRQLERTLQEAVGPAAEFHYTQDPALIAGFRITIGSWVLQANLQYELVGFAELAHE